jgi:hypothetical protein
MTVYLTKASTLIVLQARAESPDALGDLVIELRPGDEALGKTYDEWRALPDGPHQID